MEVGQTYLLAGIRVAQNSNDDNITVIITVFAVVNSRSVQGWRMGVLGVNGDVGWGLTWLCSPCSFFLPLSISLIPASLTLSTSLVTLVWVQDHHYGCLIE